MSAHDPFPIPGAKSMLVYSWGYGLNHLTSFLCLEICCDLTVNRIEGSLPTIAMGTSTAASREFSLGHLVCLLFSSWITLCLFPFSTIFLHNTSSSSIDLCTPPLCACGFDALFQLFTRHFYTEGSYLVVCGEGFLTLSSVIQISGSCRHLYWQFLR